MRHYRISLRPKVQSLKSGFVLGFKRKCFLAKCAADWLTPARENSAHRRTGAACCRPAGGHLLAAVSGAARLDRDCDVGVPGHGTTVATRDGRGDLLSAHRWIDIVCAGLRATVHGGLSQ